MMGVARLSVTAAGRPRWWAAAGPKALAGCARRRKRRRAARRPGLWSWAGSGLRGKGFDLFFFSKILFPF
jgi:hypothetical protein